MDQNPLKNMLYVAKDKESISLTKINPTNAHVIVLDGKKITDVESLFTQIADLCHYPAYFGRNWNALYDCMTDSYCQPEGGILYLFTDASGLLLNSPADFFLFTDVFADSANFWNEHEMTCIMLIVDEYIYKNFGAFGKATFIPENQESRL